MAFKINTALKRPGIWVVSPIGSIDSSAQAVFENTLTPILDQQPEVVIFDMEHTDYISSSGIRVLLKTKKALQRYGGRQVFIHMQPQIKKVFDILNALPSLQVFASVKELDDYLDAMQKATRE